MLESQVRGSFVIALLVGAAAWAADVVQRHERADRAEIGINVVLRGDPTEESLAVLGEHGTVLDVLPQVHGVTMRADESELGAIQALSCVAAANSDRIAVPADVGPLPIPDFSGGSN